LIKFYSNEGFILKEHKASGFYSPLKKQGVYRQPNTFQAFESTAEEGVQRYFDEDSWSSS